ncbi:hypothetical protein MMC31_004064 [Peltigera leucophlebia]|nr:hypothetical protein [Peltigera leucophlebia]
MSPPELSQAQQSSEAAQLTGLFFAIYANRNRIIDVNLKQKYIDDVRRTKEETDSLFNALDIKLDPIPKCSNTKRKRDLLSGITGLLGDAVKLLSCTTEVVNNLVRAVEAPVPIISDIESLTNTLNEIAQDLEKEDQNPSNSPSESQPSSTQESTASSSAPSTVQGITTQVCTTITACGESASTAFTTVSTATSTTGVVCATDCAACANPVVKRDNPPYQREPLEKRSLDDPDDFDSANQYVVEQNDGKKLFEARVDKIVDLLTGEDKPWAGITPIRRGYLKPKGQREEEQFALRANSKVLIEYDNNQEAAFGEEPKHNQQAIYRVWLEQQKFEHQWSTKVGVQKDVACSNPNQKRHGGSFCQPAASGASTAIRTPFSTPAPQLPLSLSIPPPPSSALSTIPLPTPSPIITVTPTRHSSRIPIVPTQHLTITPAPPKTSITTSSPPDLSSKVCIDCTDALGASDCGLDDTLCLVEQCKGDKNCQACGIDCSTFALA